MENRHSFWSKQKTGGQRKRNQLNDDKSIQKMYIETVEIGESKNSCRRKMNSGTCILTKATLRSQLNVIDELIRIF